MKAYFLHEFGGVGNLQLTDTATPNPGPREVLVQVKAISINPVDVKSRAGKGMAGRLKEYMPLVLGWDISGTVTAVGDGVTEFRTGDEVFGMVNFPGHGRGYAEYVVSPVEHLAHKPAAVSHSEAAAATLAALTAWQFLKAANLKAGQRVLVHAAAGGVGHYAVQLAKHLGAYVIGTASAANRDFVLDLGADAHVDYHHERLEEAAPDIDFVFDAVGGDTAKRSLPVIKPGGALVSIPSPLPEAVTEAARHKGVNAYFSLVSSNGNDMKELAALLGKGILRSHVAATYPFADMAKAHLHVETGRTKGKVIVTL